jgi:arabinan endo-1,5-alpha-L-arabinosidase
MCGKDYYPAKRAGMNSARGVVVLFCLFLLSPGMLNAAAAYAHDPELIREGDFYYLFATGQGIPVQRSRDLSRWEYLKPVFAPAPAWTSKEVPGFDGSLWAPDISYRDGMYYLYYSVSTFGRNRSCIGLATNVTLDQSSPRFHWTDKGKVIESIPGRNNWNAIDPALAVDAQGRWFLCFGSFWDGIKMIEVDSATGKPREPPRDPIALARRPAVVNDPIEAPYIVFRNDYYYLFVSFDYCCRGVRSDYKIAAGRSREISGPYVDRSCVLMSRGGGTVLLEGYDDVHGPGHCSVLNDRGQDLLVHHEYDGNRGGAALLQVRLITWTDDGWPAIGEPLSVR